MYGYLMSVWTAASLISVIILGIVKFNSKTRFWIMAISFTLQSVFMVAAYMSNNFILTCIFSFIGAFVNTAGNTIFSSAMMLALPEENRGTILGFINSSCIGGSALSAIIYGFLGELFPLSIVFAVGNIISLIPMIYLCFNKRTKEFILTH